MWHTLAEFLPWRRLIVVLVVLALIGVLVALAVVCAAAGLGAYLIVQASSRCASQWTPRYDPSTAQPA